MSDMEEGLVEVRHWHVYYRTTTMADMNQNGWKKAVIQVEGDQHAALQYFIENNRNLLYVRIYEGPHCLAARITQHQKAEVVHEPHATL